jgi:hypothetical protein
MLVIAAPRFELVEDKDVVLAAPTFKLIED